MKNNRNSGLDMLHGSLWDKILLFAIPLAASSILQQLFNSADIAVAGRFAGSEALAAVGGNSAVISLFINMFVGLSVGANVVIANYIGQGSRDKIGNAVHTIMALAIASGVFLVFAGMIMAKPILILIDTPSDVLPLATLYLRIYFCGMPFMMIYNFGSAILRSVGDSKRPLYFLTVAGILNVLLNLLLVIVFHMGVAGVGIATVVSSGVSALLTVIALMKEDGELQLDLHKLKFHREPLINIIKIGVPAGIQGVVFSLSNVCIQAEINSFGTNAIAGSAAALNYEYFTYFVTSAFTQAAVTFTAQNYGAANRKRCRNVFLISLMMGMSATFIMSAVFVAGRSFFAGIYTSDAKDVEFAVVRMLHVQILEFLPCVYEIAGGVLRGMGKSLTPAVLTIFGSCVLRIVWIYTVFRYVPTFGMLLWVYPVTWIITSIMMMTAYAIERRKSAIGVGSLQNEHA